ncbi:DUF4192 domain-containing protein [Nocardia brasiliensis]|uniref:DUF4192 domain-containing protein n=1 Tax=Nocardia brasiliensis TaxID=37326 RepID=UPI002458BB5B|nr:DUF4192 domain-containing protein [Nocardia brasiliensis]
MSSSYVSLDNPGDLIAALPSALGFTPHRSLAVLVLCDTTSASASSLQVTALVRIDLDSPVQSMAPVIRRICRSCESTLVSVVVVDDRLEMSTAREHPISKRPYRKLIKALTRLLYEAGIELCAAWATPAIESGAPWCRVRGRTDTGVLPDPSTSMFAAKTAAEGDHTFSSRSELAALLDVDQPMADRVAELLPLAEAVVDQQTMLASPGGDPDVYPRRALERLLWLISSVESGHLPTLVETVQTAIALRDRRVRDSVLAIAVGPHAHAAESLWLHLTRSLPTSERAGAATLVGYSAYARGDGALAGLALQRALEADPEHSMAILLETALSLGMKPQHLRRLARSGVIAAHELGIDLDIPSEFL